MEPRSESSLLTRLLRSRSRGIRGFNQAHPRTPQCCPDTMMDGLQKYLKKPASLWAPRHFHPVNFHSRPSASGETIHLNVQTGTLQEPGHTWALQVHWPVLMFLPLWCLPPRLWTDNLSQTRCCFVLLRMLKAHFHLFTHPFLMLLPSRYWSFCSCNCNK